MGVFSLSKAATAILLVGAIGVNSEGTTARVPKTNDRVLRAAMKRSDILKRSSKIEQKFEIELPYVEEPTLYNGHSIFASQLKVASKKPVLNLEEIEHHLADVQCGGGKMKLKFFDSATALDARLACHSNDGGIVVTSHQGCNKDGERAVYTVHGVSSTGDGSALELSVADSLFEYAFDRLEVGFGHTEEHHLVREHSDFFKLRRKRQEGGKGEVSGNVNGTEVLEDVPENIADNVHDVKFDLNWEVTDKSFKPDEILAGLPVGFTLNNIANIPIELGCKKCLTKGDITLSQGNIQIDVEALKGIPDKIKAIPGMVASAVPSLINEIPGKIESVAAPAVSAVTSIINAVPSKVESIVDAVPSKVESIVDAVPSKIESIAAPVKSVINDIIPDVPDIDLPFGRRGRKAKRGVDFDLGKVVTGGFVELKADNMEAYFEMLAKPKKTGYFTFRLFELPILGFVIPGVGRAGAIFEALLEADYEIEGGFEMSYGMNLVVPSNSTFRIDIGDMSQSGVKGFQDSTLTPLPFTFKQKDIDAFVSIALVPSIPIGFKFLSVLDVSVEAELDLPRLDALLTTIPNADTQCNDLDMLEGGDEEEGETEEGETEEGETEEGETEGEEETPADEEPVDDEPADDEPVDDEPIDDEPVDDEPVDDEPVDDEIPAEDSELAAERRRIRRVRRNTPKPKNLKSRKVHKAHKVRREEAPFPLTNGTTNGTQPDTLSLLLVEWNVSMSVDLGFNFVLPAIPATIPGVDINDLIPFKPVRKHTAVFTTVKPLPTLCLAPKKGFRPATDVYTNPTNVGTGVGTIGTTEPTATPKFTAVPTNNATDAKLKRRNYGYGVPIEPPNSPTPTPSSTSTSCEKSSTPTPPPPPPPSNECGAYGQPACESSELPPPPPETTPFESTSSETPPPENTPPPSDCGNGDGQTPCESSGSPPPPPETTQTTPVESTSSEVPPPPETTPAESSSTEVPPPPQTTPIESSSSEVPPSPPESTPCNSTSTLPPPPPPSTTPCNSTMTSPPAPPTKTPCTTGNTITITLPYNTTSSGYQAPPSGTASPPVPTKPSEFTGAAATALPTLSIIVFSLLAALMVL